MLCVLGNRGASGWELLVEVRHAVKNISSIAKLLKYENRDYGYFTMRRKSDGRVLLVYQIGECPPEKAEKYMALSLEKSQRLFERHHDFGDISSFQSRKPCKGMWGGAICLKDVIFSFSGLPELADEAVVLATAFQLDVISKRQIKRIIDISNNHFAKEYFYG